jgi:hypothetical protein
LFSYLNRNRIRCYFANGLTLGLYGALYVVLKANRIGKVAGANYPGPALSVLLTIVSLGVYAGVMLPVLAFGLGRVNASNVGTRVLLLDIASLLAAVVSGGLFVFISVALWAHAFWLLVEAEAIAFIAGAHDNSLKPTPSGGASSERLSL